MYRLGSYKGVTGVFLRFFEMFFPGHALSRQNKGFKEGVQRLRGFKRIVKKQNLVALSALYGDINLNVKMSENSNTSYNQ